MKQCLVLLKHAFFAVFLIFLAAAPYHSDIVKACFCIGLFLWIAINSIEHRKRFYRYLIPPSVLNKPLFFFLAAALLSTVFSNDFRQSQSILFERYIPYAFFFWFGVALCRPQGSKEIQGGMPLFAKVTTVELCTGLILLSSFTFGLGGAVDYFRYRSFRLWTVFGRNIAFGMFPIYLVFYIPVCFALASFAKRKWMKIMAIISLIVLVPCWIWQGSRMAWVAVPAGLAYIIFVKRRKWLFWLCLILIIFVLLLTLVQGDRINNLYNLDTWTLPVIFWSTALSIFLDYPIFGSGLGMFEHLYSVYRQQLGYTVSTEYLHAHNTYLEIAAEVGFVGLLAFLNIFYTFFKRLLYVLKKTSHQHHTLLIGLGGTIFATLIFGIWMSTITVGTQSSPLFWGLFGIAAGLLEPKESVYEKA